jgi:hypothetical protein
MLKKTGRHRERPQIPHRGIQIFKTNREKSMAVMKKYLRGAAMRFPRNLQLLQRQDSKDAHSLADAIRTALDMMSDQFSQAKNVDPKEVIDLSSLVSRKRRLSKVDAAAHRRRRTMLDIRFDMASLSVSRRTAGR